MNREFPDFIPVLIVRADRFIGKIFSTKSQQKAARITARAEKWLAYKQLFNCLDAKLWSLDHWSGIVSDSFEAHCKRSNSAILLIIHKHCASIRSTMLMYDK